MTFGSLISTIIYARLFRVSTLQDNLLAISALGCPLAIHNKISLLLDNISVLMYPRQESNL